MSLPFSEALTAAGKAWLLARLTAVAGDSQWLLLPLDILQEQEEGTSFATLKPCDSFLPADTSKTGV